MRLSLYFFRQYIPSFLFGFALFSFIFLLDKLFDLIDLILNKGVSAQFVIRLIALFIPTAFPLALPMAILMACMVTFGRLAEENEITAIRASGISLMKVLWIFPLFAFITSVLLIPFNTQVAPWINRSFRTLYQQIINADPLIKIEPKRFFAIKNTKIFAHEVDPHTKTLTDVFVYQLRKDGKPADRVFARSGLIETSKDQFKMILNNGQLQQHDLEDPAQLIHTTFGEYIITIPLKLDKSFKSTRFRNIPSGKLKELIDEQKKKGFKTSGMEAENSLRYAIAFAPFCLILIGIPLATALKKGGKAFNVGISLVVIFSYYLLLIFGLTIAEKGVLPSDPALWVANLFCIGLGLFLIKKLIKK